MLPLIMFLQAAASWSTLTAPIAAAIAVIGAAFGIGKIGSSAMESIARQPEAAGDVFKSTLIVAALIEGATLFAIVVCLLSLYV